MTDAPASIEVPFSEVARLAGMVDQLHELILNRLRQLEIRLALIEEVLRPAIVFTLHRRTPDEEAGDATKTD